MGGYITILGYFAGFMSTTSSLPQIVKAIKTRKTQDLSYITISMIITGGILWTVYGVFLNDLPLIIWDAIPACLYTCLFIIKYLCDNQYLLPIIKKEPILESIKIESSLHTKNMNHRYKHGVHVHHHHPIHIHRRHYPCSLKLEHTNSVISI